MKRKIIRQGNNTLTITLPKDWAEEQNLQAGNELEVAAKGDHLEILNLKTEKKRESIDVDISNLDRSSIIILIQTLYRFGYDTINIRTDRITMPHYRLSKEVPISSVIHETINRLIGSELISSTSDFFSIKKITEESKGEFDTVLRRLFRLLKEEMSVFMEGIEKKDEEILKSIEFHHINIKKFVNFCLRLLNKFGHDNNRKTTFYFSIIQYLSKIDDFIKNAARYISKNGFAMSARAAATIREVFGSVDLFYDLFYDFGLKKVEAFIKCREEIRSGFFKKAKEYSKEDLVIVSGLLQIVELVLDMTELRMALEN